MIALLSSARSIFNHSIVCKLFQTFGIVLYRLKLQNQRHQSDLKAQVISKVQSCSPSTFA